MYKTKCDFCKKEINKRQKNISGTHFCNNYCLRQYRLRINKIIIEGDITKIFCENKNDYLIIDTEDFEKVKAYRWHIDANGYGIGNNNSIKQIKLHRLITNATETEMIDHKDGITKNNKKENLRICTPSTNCQNRALANNYNSSGIRGLYWLKREKMWRVNIFLERKKLYEKGFTSKEEAIKTLFEKRKEYGIKIYNRKDIDLANSLGIEIDVETLESELE